MCDKCTARAKGMEVLNTQIRLKNLFDDLTKARAATIDFRYLVEHMAECIEKYNHLMGKTIGFKKECPACNQFEDADTFNNNVCACCDWNN